MSRVYRPSTLIVYRSQLPKLRHQREALLQANSLTLEQQKELERLERAIATRQYAVAQGAQRTKERELAEQAERERLDAIEAEFAQLPDETLRDVVDDAYFWLALDAARQYGLIEGGPEVNIERCEAALRAGERRGIRSDNDPEVRQ